MNTIAALIAGATGGACLMLGYCCRYWQQRQHALQWFYSKQSRSLSVQSEAVKEGLLQKAFAIRRVLESSTISPPDEITQHLDNGLLIAESFNHDLSQVGDELATPFLEDSLPLAIQYLVKKWGENVPKRTIKLKLPTDWPWHRTDKHRLVLWCIHECLLIWQTHTEPVTTSQEVQLALTNIDEVAKLRINCSSQGSSNQGANGLNDSAMVNELQYIRLIFNVLMPGRCRLKHGSLTFDCEFSWPLKNVDTEWSR